MDCWLCILWLMFRLGWISCWFCNCVRYLRVILFMIVLLLICGKMWCFVRWFKLLVGVSWLWLYCGLKFVWFFLCWMCCVKVMRFMWLLMLLVVFCWLCMMLCCVVLSRLVVCWLVWCSCFVSFSVIGIVVIWYWFLLICLFGLVVWLVFSLFMIVFCKLVF